MTTAADLTTDPAPQGGPSEWGSGSVVGAKEFPTWRSCPLAMTGWEDEIDPGLWAAITIADELDTAGELADELLAGTTFGAGVAELQTVCALVEQISEDDPVPLKIPTPGLAPEAKAAPALVVTKLSALDDFPDAVADALLLNGITTAETLLEQLAAYDARVGGLDIPLRNRLTTFLVAEIGCKIRPAEHAAAAVTSHVEGPKVTACPPAALMGGHNPVSGSCVKKRAAPGSAVAALKASRARGDKTFRHVTKPPKPDRPGPTNSTRTSGDVMTDRTVAHRGTSYVVTVAHPAADEFPWLPEQDLQELADDIAAHGQRDDIELLPDGRVLDGRNRELACRIAGVEPRYLRREDELTDDQVIDFVISRGFHRRNWTPSQRAMAAAGLANMRQGRPGKTGTGAGLTSDTKESKASQADVAKKFDVSERSVRSAKKVKDKAPEIAEQVKKGTLDVKTADQVADLSPAQRKKIAGAADPKKEAKKALAKAAPKADAPPASGAAPAAEPAPAVEEPTVVSGLNKICTALDRLKAEVVKLAGEPLGRHIHKDSVVSQIEAARKALWQARPTEPCNCVAGGAAPKPECRACFGHGVTCAGRVLKGVRK